MGGGGNGDPGFRGRSGNGTELIMYLGFDADDNTFSNENGTYTLESPTATQVKITGVGKEVGQNGTSPVEADVTVMANLTSGAVKDSISTTN